MKLARRRGSALATVLVTLILTGALAAAMSLRVAESLRAARRAALRELARGAAETALWTTAATLDARRLRGVAVGVSSSDTRADTTTVTTARVVRTSATDVWIVASAVIRWGSETARERVALSAELAADTADARVRVLPGRAWVAIP